MPHDYVYIQHTQPGFLRPHQIRCRMNALHCGRFNRRLTRSRSSRMLRQQQGSFGLKEWHVGKVLPPHEAGLESAALLDEPPT